VWSRSSTRDHAVTATSRYAGITHSPYSSVSRVTAPEATAQWMEIFQAAVIAASTATLASMHPKYQVSWGGAPPVASTRSPIATDARMKPSTISRGPRAPTFRSAHRPLRTPRVMNTVGKMAANSAATSPQARPLRPP